MRFPIDQVYVTDGINLTHFGRGPDIGSDHFPMITTVFLND
jgi:endonuclease/exonuclease/phosphatase (EEP) superfamily protein YafD